LKRELSDGNENKREILRLRLAPSPRAYNRNAQFALRDGRKSTRASARDDRLPRMFRFFCCCTGRACWEHRRRSLLPAALR
jgi:hypothetical protein